MDTFPRLTMVAGARGWRLFPRSVAVAAVLLLWGASVTHGQRATTVQFIFTSDAHYGITRPRFRGQADVPARVVNAQMVARMHALPEQTFPKDGGVRAGERIGPFDFLAEGGDVANREEVTKRGAVQTASASWAEFVHDYLEGLQLTGPAGARAPVYVVPGNHDVSNAIGYPKPLAGLDPASLVGIYNHMMAPLVPKTSATYRYPEDRVLASHDIGGLHFVFITMWPDVAVRAWMEQNLAGISPTTPVIVFAHDQPESQAKHFTNPNGTHDINARDQFENLLGEPLADGITTHAKTLVEQRALQTFLARHPNVTAYFHGNSNWNQFYDWTGPDNRVVLHTFRVDSPMKGAVSLGDETKLSFQVATIDTVSRRMTVRECLWNPAGAATTASVAWGGSTTVALSPRPGDLP